MSLMEPSLRPQRAYTGFRKVRVGPVEDHAGMLNDHRGIAGDGVFSLVMGDAIKLVDLKTNTTTALVDRVDLKDVSGF